MDTSRHHPEGGISLAVSRQRQRQLRRIGIRIVNYEHGSSLCKINWEWILAGTSCRMYSVDVDVLVVFSHQENFNQKPFGN